MDQKLTSKLEHEIISRKDAENKLHRYDILIEIFLDFIKIYFFWKRFLDEKVNFLKTDISIENKVRTEIIGN